MAWPRGVIRAMRPLHLIRPPSPCWAAAVLASLLTACGAGEPPPPGFPDQDAPAVEVLRYAYDLDLATDRMAVSLTLDLPAPGGNCVSLPSALAPTQPPAWGGAPARATHDGSHLRVCSGAAPRTGPLRLDVAVQLREGHAPGIFQVGYYRLPDRAGRETTVLLGWLSGCSTFGPCDDAVARQVEVDLTVRHAAGLTVLCPGAREATATTTRCRIDGGVKAPLYSALTVVAHPAWQPTVIVDDPVGRLVLWEAPDGLLGGALDREVALQGMRHLTGLLGPLPYGPELRVAGLPMTWLGFEPPGNLLLDEGLPLVAPVDYARPALHTLLHELAHQWAGDRTTLSEPRDVVWKEAIAEYLAYVVEEAHGAPGEAAVTRAGWQRSGRSTGLWPLSLDPTARPIDLAANAYGAGTMTLFVQLEPFLGRAALLDAITRFLDEPGVRPTQALRAALEDAGGVSLETWWARWVEGPGEPLRPELAVAVEAEAVRITQVQPGPALPLEVEVELVGATRRVRIAARFDLQAPPSEVVVQHALGEAVVEAILDPDRRLLYFPAAQAAGAAAGRGG